ncbi:MAG: sensor histidine kinase [Halobacteria archaeon]
MNGLKYMGKFHDDKADGDKNMRLELYKVVNEDIPFKQKARKSMELGKKFLDVDNGHIAKIDQELGTWISVVSTEPDGGDFPEGMELDLKMTYCRKVVERESPIKLRNAPEQGWSDDRAYKEHGVRCYYGSPIELEDGVYGTACFVSHDSRKKDFDEFEKTYAELITRLLEFELERNRTETKIRRLEKFVEVVSHDLKNPLSVTRGRIEAEKPNSDTGNLEKALEGLDRVEVILEDMLTLAMGKGKVSETERIDLEGIATSAWETVDTADIELKTESRLSFEGDPVRIRQIFENIYRNSVRHGEGVTTVEVGVLDNREGFYIEDDGGGIDPQLIDEVFDPGIASGSGSGFGLHIVREVVDSHGWDIDVYNTESGARFQFEI